MTNTKNIGLALLSLALSLGLLSCDKATDSLGLTTMPDYTQVTMQTHSVPLTYRTILADVQGEQADPVAGETGTMNSIYVHSSYSYLGEIPNPQFGAIKSEYLTQVYVPSGFKFAEEPYMQKVDSAFITLYYNGYTGDPKQPMAVSAYRLARPLPQSHYSIGDISAYVSDYKLGEASYTAEKGNDTIQGSKVIKIPLDVLHPGFGQDIYDKAKGGDPIFKSQQSFNEQFPGIYLRCSAGKGSVLRIHKTSLSFYYQFQQTIKRPTKPDSTFLETHIQELSHTSEVPQLSRYSNEGLQRLQADPENVYIKAPAGLFVEVTIPTVEIAKLLEEEKGYVKELNSIPYTIVGESNEQNLYTITPPSDILALPKDSLKTFFEKEQTELNAPYTTYVGSTGIAGTSTYTFGNIATIVQRHIETKPQENLVLVLVPIERITGVDNRGNSTGVSSSISNQVLPSAVRLSLKEGQNMTLKVFITKRKSGTPF